MTASIRLPGGADYQLAEPRSWPRPAAAPVSRIAYAAAHVVADPLADNTPGARTVIDWDATLAQRHRLWDYGLGVADAMDTAQRGMGLDWPTTRELIRRSTAAAAGPIVCGVGTDQLSDGEHDLDAVIAAYEEQLEVVEGSGATVVLMASRQLAAAAHGPEDYAQVYDRLLGQVSRPVILHWLGPMFDPGLSGYWGAEDLDAATDSLLAIIGNHTAVVDGVKVSLLDPERERRLRSAVRVYTGDDFHYPELIRGDADGHSHALLGVFDAIAPAAAAALAALDAGDLAGYDAAFGPTVPLARHLFAAPTYYYKTGLVFVSWLAGQQDAFSMVGGLQSARSLRHLITLFQLADQAGLLPDPDLAVTRMRALLQVGGVAR